MNMLSTAEQSTGIQVTQYRIPKMKWKVVNRNGVLATVVLATTEGRMDVVVRSNLLL